MIAVVVDGHALLLTIEHPPVAALKANLLVPVPQTAALVRNLHERGLHASSSFQIIALIAGKASSSKVVGLALI